MNIFILALIMSTGELTLETIQVEECPPKEELVATMEELKSKGEIIEWDANCVMLPVAKGQPI